MLNLLVPVLITTFLVSSSVSAAAIHCRAPDGAGDLHLFLEIENRTFSFAQFCWNPCHMGEGKIVSGPLFGWSGIRYRLELADSEHLISPFTGRTMTAFFDFDMKSATLSANQEHIKLECTEGVL